ncbi:MAG: hypothetical protein RPU64_04540 [Candidatus Sedimenticola sp. (ex Thyasira tokunagai)]
MTEVVKEIKKKIDEAEADGSQVTGIHLTAEMAKAVRWELTQMYGSDPGEDLMPLYGAAVLSRDAPELKLEI